MGARVSSLCAILQLSLPAEAPLWEGLAWGLTAWLGVGGGVCLTSKNLLQIRENMKELDFDFQGLPDLGALGWGAIWWCTLFPMDKNAISCLPKYGKPQAGSRDT